MLKLTSLSRSASVRYPDSKHTHTHTHRRRHPHTRTRHARRNYAVIYCTTLAVAQSMWGPERSWSSARSQPNGWRSGRKDAYPKSPQHRLRKLFAVDAPHMCAGVPVFAFDLTCARMYAVCVCYDAGETRRYAGDTAQMDHTINSTILCTAGCVCVCVIALNHCTLSRMRAHMCVSNVYSKLKTTTAIATATTNAHTQSTRAGSS